jgi:hypothetical protein
MPDPAPASDPAPAPAWHEAAGLDADTVGWLTTNNAHTDANAALKFASGEARRYQTQFGGVPSSRLVTIPENLAEAGALRPIYERLGAPKEATGYDFSNLKFSDGSDVDATFTDWIRGQAFEHGLSASAANQIAGSFVKFLETGDASETAERTAALAGEKDSLAKSWGPNFQANHFLAQQGAAKLGITPEEVAALESVVGYAKVMEAMRRVGESTSEARFVQNQNPANPGTFTREQAVARKNELMADAAWNQRYLNGGTGSKEFREMQGLLSIITGETGNYEAA